MNISTNDQHEIQKYSTIFVDMRACVVNTTFLYIGGLGSQQCRQSPELKCIDLAAVIQRVRSGNVRCTVKTKTHR